MFEELLLASVPVAGAATVFYTISKCYSLTMSKGKMAPGVVFPAISALGTEAPEQALYQAGFGLTGALIALSVILFRVLIAPLLLKALMDGAGTLPADQLVTHKAMIVNHLKECWKGGMYMAGGVFLQGIFTLELQISFRSIVHWAGAAVFITGAMNHCQTVIKLYTEAAKTSPFFQNSMLQFAFTIKRFTQSVPVMMFVLPLLFQMYQSRTAKPTEETEGDGAADEASGAKLENMMGLMQWGLVVSFIVFFATYVVDFYLAASEWHKTQDGSILAQLYSLDFGAAGQ